MVKRRKFAARPHVRVWSLPDETAERSDAPLVREIHSKQNRDALKRNKSRLKEKKSRRK